jgi:hypothetical protein
MDSARGDTGRNLVKPPGDIFSIAQEIHSIDSFPSMWPPNVSVFSRLSIEAAHEVIEPIELSNIRVVRNSIYFADNNREDIL